MCVYIEKVLFCIVVYINGVLTYRKYVKEQKAIREEMSRVSSKNIFRVQEQVNSLRQQLSVVSNGLQRNAVAIAKLKEESNKVRMF